MASTSDHNVAKAFHCAKDCVMLRLPAQLIAQLIENSQLHAALLDEEDDQHILIPGEWRELAQLYDLPRVIGGNKDTNAGKRQREILMHHFNYPVGVVYQWL